MDSRVTFRRADRSGAAWLIVEGDVDARASSSFIDAAWSLIRAGSECVVLDLQGVERFDATAVRILEATASDARRAGLRLETRAPDCVRHAVARNDLSVAAETMRVVERNGSA
jgi:anti-anti-sigma regulatory factor